MYFRVTKRRNVDGSEVRYYQLAENVWDPKKRCAVAKVVYNFGRSDEVNDDTLRRLAASILRVVDPSTTADPSQDLVLRGAWSFGGVYLVEKVWQELGIDQLLGRLLKAARIRQPFERALFAMVANRCLQPYSKLYCWEQWLREEVFLPSAQDLELHHLYRAMDFLEEHKAELEKAVYFSMADLMNADVDLIFYDTTSLHFEVDQEDEAQASRFDQPYAPLRKRGYSKNGRDDAPQIIVGLAVTRDGLPVRSWVFPGHTADVTTVERVKSDLRGWRLGRCVFVADAGMNSEENRRKLALGNGKYIVAAKMRAGDEVTRDVLARAGRYHEVAQNLRVKEVIVGDGERRRRYVVCHNPDEAARQHQHRSKLVEQLEAELSSMAAASDGKHSKRTCELLASARFGRYLRQTATGQLRIDRSAVTEAQRYDGKWVITSNDDTLSAEDLALGYKQLMRVEQCWRQLKSGLRMRPVWHWRPWRICAHVTISVLALLIERVVEIRAADTWRNVIAELGHIKVVEYDRGPARIQQTTALPAACEQLLRKLKVDPPPKIHAVAPAPSDGQSPPDQPPST